jgi:hypothetical protein
MARLFFVVVLILAVVIGAGFYLGWFQVTSDHSTTNPSYTVTVDKDKINEDKAKAEEKLHDVEHKVQARIAPATQP